MVNKLQTSGSCPDGSCCESPPPPPPICLTVTLAGAECEECTLCQACIDDEMNDIVNDSFNVDSRGATGIPPSGFGFQQPCLWQGTCCAPCGVGGLATLVVTKISTGNYKIRLNIDDDALVWDHVYSDIEEPVVCREFIDGKTLEFNSGESEGREGSEDPLQCDLTNSTMTITVFNPAEYCDPTECPPVEQSTYCLQGVLAGIENPECGCSWCAAYNAQYTFLQYDACLWQAEVCQSSNGVVYNYCDGFLVNRPEGVTFISIQMITISETEYILRASLNWVIFDPEASRTNIIVWDKTYSTKPDCRHFAGEQLTFNSELSNIDTETECDPTGSTLTITSLEDNDCDGLDVDCLDMPEDCDPGFGNVLNDCLDASIPEQAIVTAPDSWDVRNCNFVPATCPPGGTFVCERSKLAINQYPEFNYCNGAWGFRKDFEPDIETPPPAEECVFVQVTVAIARQTFAGTDYVTIEVRIIFRGSPTSGNTAIFTKCLEVCPGPNPNADCWQGGAPVIIPFRTNTNGANGSCRWPPFTGNLSACNHPSGGDSVTVQFVL